MTRKIIHLDLDAFFCAVEQLRKPELQGRPFAVGGRPEERGVVSSCSYAARVFGVRSAMPMKRALQLCPDMIILPADHHEYRKFSRFVMEHLNQLSPVVEQISIDEAFIEISDMPDHPEQFAYRLQHDIRQKFQLPSSLGAATNKLVAKIANDFGKSRKRSSEPPNAVTFVPAGDEAAFLAPLPVIALWGVGPKTSLKLAELGIKTIGDLAKWPESELIAIFGKNGREISRHSKGLDESPVLTSHETKSISQETTFAEDTANLKFLLETLRVQSDEVGRRLRAGKLSGKTVKLKIRRFDFHTFTRQVTLTESTDQNDVIYATVEKLFIDCWKQNMPVRLVGVGVSGLSAYTRQLTLWDTATERRHKLQEAIDRLQSRYGKQSIQRGKK
jgi:DNA polymerase IV